MSRRILLLLLFLWLPGVVFAAPHVILVMGDSLSAGYGLHPGQDWPTLLRAKLKAEGYDYTVVNASVSGETTGGGLTRFPQAFANAKPGIVILELGANDGLRGLPLSEMQANLGKMLSLSQQGGARPLLVTMLLPPNYGKAYVEGFAGSYPALARQYKVPLAPFLLAGIAEHRGLLQADGLHPLAVAEPQVLANIWPSLKPLLHKSGK
ncbi:MAG TPA: arylesterase [Gammaproteobacteria bacterium]